MYVFCYITKDKYADFVKGRDVKYEFQKSNHKENRYLINENLVKIVVVKGAIYFSKIGASKSTTDQVDRVAHMHNMEWIDISHLYITNRADLMRILNIQIDPRAQTKKLEPYDPTHFNFVGIVPCCFTPLLSIDPVHINLVKQIQKIKLSNQKSIT